MRQSIGTQFKVKQQKRSWEPSNTSPEAIKTSVLSINFTARKLHLEENKNAIEKERCHWLWKELKAYELFHHYKARQTAIQSNIRSPCNLYKHPDTEHMTNFLLRFHYIFFFIFDFPLLWSRRSQDNKRSRTYYTFHKDVQQVVQLTSLSNWRNHSQMKGAPNIIILHRCPILML